MALQRMVLGLALLAVTAAHVCMISPKQRGKLDISQPGSEDCVRPPAPCGGQAGAAPGMSFVAGQSYDLQFQQNLNHYNPGYPGRLWVKLSSTYPATQQSAFTITLWEGSDYWSHWQGSQTNFTVSVTFPADLTCSHCVLQTVYAPNKPTEPVFHQCSDISVTAPQARAWPSGYVYAWGGARVPVALREFTNTLYVTRPGQDGGELIPVNTNLGDLAPVDGVATSCTACKSAAAFWLARNNGQWTANQVPTRLVMLKKGEASIIDFTPSKFGVTQWDALFSTDSESWPLGAVGRLYNSTSDAYAWKVFRCSEDYRQCDAVGRTPDDDLYVNFFYASNGVSASGKIAITIVAGNENDPFGLTALLHTVTYDGAGALTTTTATQDASNWSLSHLIQSTNANALFDVSPGLGGVLPNNTAFSYALVKAARSGAVTKIADVTFPVPVIRTWGGAVYGQATFKSGGDELFLRIFQAYTADGSIRNLLVPVSTTSGANIEGVNGDVALYTKEAGFYKEYNVFLKSAVLSSEKLH